MNQQRNRQIKENKKCRGSLTLEASIVLVTFLVFYMAILSAINMYRAQVLIQNAANQTAQEIAQYTYILKKAGLADFGQGASDQSDEFIGQSNEVIGTVFAFFEATSNGLDAGKEAAATISSQSHQNVPADLTEATQRLEELSDAERNITENIENIRTEYQQMMDTGEAYFSDPQAIFNGMLSILRDGACDSIKIAVAMPITKGLMEKYLAAYGSDHLENLGVVGGNAGITYWGSSILLDMQSIEVKASYKMKIDLPFLDLLEYDLRTTASTRAWIGDGTHNDNGGEDSGRGVALDDKATGKPGLGPDGGSESSEDGGIPAGSGDTTEDNPKITMSMTNRPSQEILDAIAYIGFTEEEFIALMNKPVSEYTNEDYAYMQAARDYISHPDAGTTMVKVIDADTAQKYLDGIYQGIQGCITTESATADSLGTYDNTVESLRLDYTTGSGARPFPDGGNEYFYLEFNILSSQVDNLDIPRAEYLGGGIAEPDISPPQTGNGFLGSRNGAIIPEWNVAGGDNALTIQDGTVIWRVVDGQKQQYAVYSNGQFNLVD